MLGTVPRATPPMAPPRPSRLRCPSDQLRDASPIRQPLIGASVESALNWIPADVDHDLMHVEQLGDRPRQPGGFAQERYRRRRRKWLRRAWWAFPVVLLLPVAGEAAVALTLRDHLFGSL